MTRQPRCQRPSKRRARPGRSFNEPKGVYPKRLETAKRPKRIDIGQLAIAQDQLSPQAEQFTAVKKHILASQKIVVISGAGMSVNAGIPDFRKSSGRNSSRDSFDRSVKSSKEYHTMISDMLARASKAEPTDFHRFLDELAKSDRLYHYTQNVDGLENKLPWLSHKTTHLHGRVDTLVCSTRSIHTLQVALKDFQQRVGSDCPECTKANKERVERGKRSHTPGKLVPKVLLYGEAPDETVIGDVESVLQEVDAVIIVGTRLQIRSARKLAEEFCRASKWAKRDGLTLWVNKERSTLGPKFDFLLDYQILGDCDIFASLVSK